MLCAICVAVLESRANLIWFSRKEDDPEMNYVITKCGQHRTTGTLIASVAEGCLVCKSFWDMLPKSEQASLPIEESAISSRAHRAIGEDEGLSGWLTTLTWSPERYYNGSYFLVLRFARSDGKGMVDIEGFEWRAKRYGVCVLQPVTSSYYSHARCPTPKLKLQAWISANPKIYPLLRPPTRRL